MGRLIIKRLEGEFRRVVSVERWAVEDISYFYGTSTICRASRGSLGRWNQIEHLSKIGGPFFLSLCYQISSELNMILYVGKGYSTPSDFFALEEAAFLKHPRQPGMITLVDALELSTSFDLRDIRHFIGNIAGMAKSGMEPGPYFMITRDWGLHLLADAATLMAGTIDLKARMFHTLEEAIVALGLSDHKEEIIQLWNECKMEASELRARQQTQEFETGCVRFSE